MSPIFGHAWLCTVKMSASAPCMFRCNDVQELTSTIRQFGELSLTCRYGGTLSSTMDAMLSEIQRKSGQSIEEFSRQCPHLSDLMESDRFDLAFFRLRRELKANEHELSWILRQCFTRSTTLQSKLTLLNVFHGAYQRDVVQRALVSEEQSIIRSLEEEFRLVSSLIDEAQTNVNHSHWPPIARQLLSLHGYRQRISHLFEQFVFLCPKILQGEQGWEIKQTYQMTTDKIKKYSSTLSLPLL